MLARHEVPAHMLTLEITETSLMADSPQAIDLLVRLNAIGVRLSIDDFGTGYSSLAYLRHLPVDCLKVDRSFVAELEAGEGTSGLIVAGIVQMSHALGLDSVGEGVETRAQADRLRELGCRSAQGFLFARPMDAEAIGRLLAASSEPAAGLPL